MKSHCFFSPTKSVTGFTLIEMIGVMAILTIMAAVLTPNVLHSIERAAVKAEADNLHALGQEIGYYLRDNNGAWPTSSPSLSWTTQLATYSSLNAADIQTNRRLMNRLYVADIANRRALLISSMRNGVALPTAANVTANFQGIWDTANGSVPPGAGWGGWTSGAAGNIEYLVIERVSLASVFQNYLQQYKMVLNNGPIATSYKIVAATGITTGPFVIPANAVGVNVPLYPGDQICLYDTTGALNFVYIVSNTPKAFTFTTSWVAQ